MSISHNNINICLKKAAAASVAAIFLFNTIFTDVAAGLSVQTPCAPIVNPEIQTFAQIEATLLGILTQINGETINDELMSEFSSYLTPKKNDKLDDAYDFRSHDDGTGKRKEGENWIVPFSFEENGVRRKGEAVVGHDKTILEMRNTTRSASEEKPRHEERADKNSDAGAERSINGMAPGILVEDLLGDRPYVRSSQLEGNLGGLRMLDDYIKTGKIDPAEIKDVIIIGGVQVETENLTKALPGRNFTIGNLYREPLEKIATSRKIREVGSIRIFRLDASDLDPIKFPNKSFDLWFMKGIEMTSYDISGTTLKKEEETIWRILAQALRIVRPGGYIFDGSSFLNGEFYPSLVRDGYLENTGANLYRRTAKPFEIVERRGKAIAKIKERDESYEAPISKEGDMDHRPELRDILLKAGDGIHDSETILQENPSLINEIAGCIADIRLQTGQYPEAIFGVSPEGASRKTLIEIAVEFIRKKDKKTLLAVENGSISGFISMTIDPEDDGSRHALLNNMAVREESRDKGYGSLLLDGAVDIIWKVGIREFYFLTKNERVLQYFRNRSVAAEAPKGPRLFFIKRDLVPAGDTMDVTIQIIDEAVPADEKSADNETGEPREKEIIEAVCGFYAAKELNDHNDMITPGGIYVATGSVKTSTELWALCREWGVKKGDKFYDFGYGDGRVAFLMASLGLESYGDEIYQPVVEKAQKILNRIRTDLLVGQVLDTNMVLKRVHLEKEAKSSLDRDLSEFDVVYFFYTFPEPLKGYSGSSEEELAAARAARKEEIKNKLLAKDGLKPGAIFIAYGAPLKEWFDNDDQFEVARYGNFSVCRLKESGIETPTRPGRIRVGDFNVTVPAGYYVIPSSPVLDKNNNFDEQREYVERQVAIALERGEIPLLATKLHHPSLALAAAVNSLSEERSRIVAIDQHLDTYLSDSFFTNVYDHSVFWRYGMDKNIISAEELTLSVPEYPVYIDTLKADGIEMEDVRAAAEKIPLEVFSNKLILMDHPAYIELVSGRDTSLLTRMFLPDLLYLVKKNISVCGAAVNMAPSKPGAPCMVSFDVDANLDHDQIQTNAARFAGQKISAVHICEKPGDSFEPEDITAFLEKLATKPAVASPSNAAISVERQSVFPQDPSKISLDVREISELDDEERSAVIASLREWITVAESEALSPDPIFVHVSFINGIIKYLTEPNGPESDWFSSNDQKVYLALSGPDVNGQRRICVEGIVGFRSTLDNSRVNCWEIAPWNRDRELEKWHETRHITGAQKPKEGPRRFKGVGNELLWRAVENELDNFTDGLKFWVDLPFSVLRAAGIEDPDKVYTAAELTQILREREKQERGDVVNNKNTTGVTTATDIKSDNTNSAGPFTYNLTQPEGTALSFRDKLLSVLTTKKVVLAFDSKIGGANSKLILDVFDEIEKLRKDPKYERFLRNLTVINTSGEKLSQEINKHLDKNTEVFVFARNTERENLQKLETKTHSTYIDEKAYDWDMYYPLPEMVTIALSQYLDPDTLNDIKGLLKDLNIAAELPLDGTIIFTLLPDAARYDKQDLIRKFAALKQALIAA